VGEGRGGRGESRRAGVSTPNLPPSRGKEFSFSTARSQSGSSVDTNARGGRGEQGKRKARTVNGGARDYRAPGAPLSRVRLRHRVAPCRALCISSPLSPPRERGWG